MGNRATRLKYWFGKITRLGPLFVHTDRMSAEEPTIINSLLVYPCRGPVQIRSGGGGPDQGRGGGGEESVGQEGGGGGGICSREGCLLYSQEGGGGGGGLQRSDTKKN